MIRSQKLTHSEQTKILMSRKCHLHLIKENMENAETITYFYCHGIKNSF